MFTIPFTFQDWHTTPFSSLDGLAARPLCLCLRRLCPPCDTKVSTCHASWLPVVGDRHSPSAVVVVHRSSSTVVVDPCR